ncbi:hypothetical protein B0H19DRAFT_1232744 [Mycena capillaripes]|nr:hypothetical protein B0H19DRAFT_1232744 [Mycena capillaripes]
MWKNHRRGVFIPSQVEPGSPVDCQVSLGTSSAYSLASTSTAAGMSIDTSATSFISSSNDADDIHGSSEANAGAAGPSTAPQQIKVPQSSKAPLHNLRASRSQTPMIPVDTKGPVRVVGRGGQGSRPRVISEAVPALVAPQVHRPVALEINPISRSDSTRMVGRGGIGSRPRDLPAPARVVLPSHSPTSTSFKQPAQQPMLYRPGGRGGAGSKPRAPKPPSSQPENKGKGKSAIFPWKGKGKDTGNVSTYGMPSLARTDTLDTMGSGAIQFLPAQVRGGQRVYQSTATQDPILETPPTSGSSAIVDSVARRTPRLQKLLRTLGAEVASPQPAPEVKAMKALRRGSISGFSFGSSISDAADFSSTAKALRRRSIETPQSLEDWKYPTPPRPPSAFPNDESESLDDTQSEYNDDASTSTDDHSELRTISSASTGPLQFDPSSLESYVDDDDSDYRWGRSPTPTAMGPDKHLSVPFQTLIESTTSWESTDAVVRKEVGWSGEWNCEDIGEVISSLRELRL